MGSACIILRSGGLFKTIAAHNEDEIRAALRSKINTRHSKFCFGSSAGEEGFCGAVLEFEDKLLCALAASKLRRNEYLFIWKVGVFVGSRERLFNLN